MKENTQTRKLKKESGSNNPWREDSFVVTYDSYQEEKNQRRYSLKEVELLHSI